MPNRARVWLLLIAASASSRMNAQEKRPTATPLEIIRAVDLVRWSDAAEIVARFAQRTTLPPNLPGSTLQFVAASQFHFQGVPDSAILLARAARATSQNDSNAVVTRWSLYLEALAVAARGFTNRADSLLAQSARLAAFTGDSALLTRVLLQRQSTNVFATRAMKTAALDSVRLWTITGDVQVAVGERCARTQSEPDFDKALALMRAAALDAEQAGARRAQLSCLMTAGVRSVNAGRLIDGARALYQVDSLAQLMNDRAIRGSVNQWHGYLQNLRGRPETAEGYLNIALENATATSSLNTLAYTWLNLANIAAASADQGRAATQYEHAEQLFTQLGNVVGALDVLYSRALVSTSRRELELADKLFARADSIARRLSDDSRLRAIRMGRTIVAIARADTTAARQLLNAETAYWKTQPDPEWKYEIASVYGLLAIRVGQYSTAIAQTKFSLTGYDETQVSLRYRGKMTLAAAYACSGNAKASARIATAALDTLDAYRATLSSARQREVNSGLLPDARYYGLGSEASLVRCLVVRGSITDAFIVAERLRDRRLRETLMQPPKGEVLDTTVPRLTANSPVPSVTLAALKRSLPKNTVVLSYTATDPITPITLFAVSANATRTYALATPDSIRPLLAALRAQLEAGRDATPLARSLATLLAGQAIRDLPLGTKQIVIVPDADLFNVPWNTLEVSSGPIGTTYALSLAPSATVAVAHWSVNVPARPLHVLAYGAPTLALDSMPPLPTAGREATGVAQRDLIGELRVGDAATESSVKNTALSAFNVIHFAAHALPAGVGATSNAGMLFLAPTAVDDGFLEASEITRLHLRGALVVLSACATAAVQPVSGEGARSLATAFLEAGASAVLATQWSVRDAEMEPLVTAFFDAFVGGISAAEALRRAQLKLQRQQQPTRVWGAFVLIGTGAMHVTPPTSRPDAEQRE